MDKVSEAILSLKPVAFLYKSDKTNTAQFGLIAEEVAEVNPELVIRDKEGKPYSVRYEAVNAMLLNEFLKEYLKVEEQEVTIARLRTEMQSVVAHLKEQDLKLQNVSAHVQLDKTAPQMVSNEFRAAFVALTSPIHRTLGDEKFFSVTSACSVVKFIYAISNLQEH